MYDNRVVPVWNWDEYGNINFKYYALDDIVHCVKYALILLIVRGRHIFYLLLIALYD